MASKGYKYSSYKKTVASTEYSLGTHEAKSTYRRETGTEYSSARGAATSTTREVVSGSDTRTLPVYIAIQDYKPEANDKDGLALEEGQIVEVLDNKNPASWLVRTKARPPQTGWAPGSLFESPAEYYRQKRKTREITNGDMHMTKGEEALAKRDTVFHELLRTEEEYVSHLYHLINTYVKLFDDPTTPAPVRQMRDQLTMNLRELYNFHANILLKGLQYYSDDPGKVGQTFVRLERDFDQHVKYFRDLPDAEKLLDDPKIKDFFDQIKGTIEKDRRLLDYLRLPQSRLLQYQQYIKELIKYTARAELSTESLQRALELMLSIPRRATDLNYIKNIQDYPGGDTVKLGRLLRHEQFRVWEGDKSGDGNLRYVFLFKSRLLFTERQDPEDPEELPEFKHVATIRLDKYEIKEEGDTLIFSTTEPAGITYYLQPTDKTQAEFAKQAWVKEVSEAKEGLGPEEGPPRKKPKSPPAISPSASTQSLASSSEGLTTTGTLEMQGARITRTQYGFRTLHESSAKMCLKVSGYPLPVITWFKDGVQLHEDERHKFYSDDDGFFAMTIDPVLVDDTGRYTCVATNEYGQATTSAFFRVVKVEKPPTPPKFATKMKDVEITEGGQATFECEVEGWPEPEVTFFVDGQAIHPSHDFQIDYDGQKATLKIRDVQPEDAGVYSLRLINEMGVKDSQAKLTVREDPDKRKVAPEFQQVIEDKTVDEGDTVKFKVLCTGDPEPDVTWQVNGHQLTPGENVNMIAEDGVYILTIKNVSTHFDGEVTCRAVNRLGDISCTGRLTVRCKAYEPSFEQELVDKTVREGQSVKFEVAIAAEPEPAVGWRINGRELKPSGNIKIGARPATGVYTLEILNVTPDLVGEVECHAENESGSAVSSAKLNISGQVPAPPTSSVSRAPIIKQEFSDITVNVGDTLRLALTTEGDQEPPVVRWLLNGKELKPEDGVTTKTEEGRHELVAESVTKELAGTIECVVENDVGSTSCKAKVTVTEGERPPTFKAGLPEALPVETGQTVKIQVNVDSKQAAKVTWLLNGEDVKNMPDHFRVTQDSKDVFNLEILDVTTDLSGEIECRLETVGGKASSKMKLTVSEPQPTIYIEQALPETVTVTESQSLNLKVKIHSDSRVKKSAWELNGREVKDSANIKTTSEVEEGTFALIVQKVPSDFSGDLVFKAENKEGEKTESKTKINVEALMALEEKKPEEPKKKVEEHIEALMALEEKPEELKKVEEEKKADEAEKAEEAKKLEEAKKEETKPVIKTEPPKEVKTTVGESLEVVVIADAPEAKVTWKLDGEEVKETANVKKISDATTGKQVLQVSEVTEEMSGEITCKIENKQGAVTAKTQLIVEKKPEPPEKKQKLMEEETTVAVEEEMEVTTVEGKGGVVGVEPKLLTELEDTLVSPGQPLKLELNVSGEPPPTVTWTLNGKEIVETADIKITSTPEGTHTLEVPKATPEFTGKIVAKVENEFGTAEATCQVATVRRRAHAKPEFQSKIPPITVAEGDTLRVRVLITGDPDPRVKWYINDRIVVETEDTQLLAEDGVYTLEIQGAGVEMIGKLKCVAYNSRGEISMTAPINVTQKIPVEFEQYLCDTQCREGDTLKLKAVLLGEPEPLVTWYVNGNKLEESQNVKVYKDKSTYTVVIKDITLDYAGEVECKAINEYGEASSKAKLNISPRGTPPDFTEWLSNVMAKEGATIKHKVVFTGDPTPVLTWYVNNEEVKPTDDDYVVKVEKDVCTLTIKNFKPSMVGEIICKAENDAGEVSCTAQMALAAAKDEFVSEHSELDAVIFSDREEGASEAGTDILDEITEEESVRTQTPIMAPKFITKIKDVRVKKGQQAIFECVVPDTKGVCVKWLKDGNEIELIARIRVKHRPGEDNAQLHQLIIESVKPTDSGLYACVLTNEAGEELSTAVLEVLEEEVPSEMAPEFTRSLEDVTVIEGARAVLECAVGGLPTPIVEWYKDGKKLKSSRALSIESTKDGAHRVIIRETTLQDAGSYEVQISSKLGTSKQEAKLIVEKKEEEEREEGEKPVFVTELRSTTVEETEEIRLECKVTGKPTPDVKWFKDEKELKKAKTVDIQSKSDGTQILSVKSSTTEDSGEYKCEASNKLGTSTTIATVTVNVAAQPMEVEEAKPKEEKPKFHQQLTSQTVEEGETVTFQCAVSGEPRPSVKLYKDGKEVKEDKTHEVVEESEGVWKLVIEKATRSDIGQYKAEATNAAGKATTEASLNVKAAEPMEVETKAEQAPEFTSPLETQTVTVGETATLECRVQGEPQPTVTWHKDGKEIKPDKRHEIESVPDGTQKLTVLEAVIQDIGQYACKATSVAGKAATESRLIVQEAEQKEEKAPEVEEEGAPEFKTPLKPCTVTEGQTAVLECAVTGTAPIVRWLKDGKELKPSDHVVIESKPDGTQKLIIEDSQAADIGDYAVEATTAGGKAKTEAHLEVKSAKEVPVEGEGETAPEFVEVLRAVQATEGQEAVLECRVAARTVPTVKWLKDGEEVKPSDQVQIVSESDGTQRLVLKDAKTEDTGEYRCEATNEAGTAWTEGPLTVKVADTVVVEGPSEVAPDFVEPLRAQRAQEGEEVHMDCKVSGIPPPEIHWFKDGEQLKPSKHVEIEARDDGTQILIVHSAKMDDVGEYRCEAVNPAGTVWSDATLTVKSAVQAAEARGEEVALQFAQALHAVQAAEGQTATFECQLDKATAAAKPEVHWYKDDEEIKPSEHVKVESKPDGTQCLVVKDAAPEDVGEYKCEVVAKDGQVAETHAPLSVAEEKITAPAKEIAPEFTTPLQECQAVEGQVAQLECAVTGQPKPEIKWFKDDKPLKPNAHVKIEETVEGTQRLIIDTVRSEDVGAYRCEAVNVAGSAQTDAKLQVSTAQQEEMEVSVEEETAPEFLQDLKEVKANEGEEAVFECKVSGFPRPEVKWFRDGRELKPSEDVELKSLPDGVEQLIIHKAQPEDQGNYRISATNVAGSMSSKAPLTVQTAEEMEAEHMPTEAPQFTEPLHDCKANEGATVQLECVVTGTPQPKIVFYKDNKPIQAGPRHVVESFIEGRQRLTVYQVRGEDAGTYQCVALNVAGKAETEADVKVEEKVDEPTFSKGLKSAKVKAGETVQMACQIGMKNQKRLPEIKWYKNGAEITPDKRVVVHAAPDGQCSLTIHQAAEDDAGTYDCVISNAAGESKTEATISVEAFKAPEFTGQFEDITVPEGATCKLETTISGLPFPEVKWLKDGKELKTKGKIKIQKDEDTGTIRLTIEDVQPQDEGTYRCTLTNEAGTASAKATVTVEGKMEVEEKLEAPKFLKGVENQNAAEGDDVTLSCVVAGEPFPEVFWFKGGRPLKPNGHYQIDVGENGQCILRIKNATPDDTASYTVKIINPAGEAESVADVYVEGKVTLEPPSFTRGLEDRTVSEKTTVVLEVEVNTTEVFVKWLRNGQEVKPADGKITIEKISDKVHRLTIHSTSTSVDQGEYTAVATNEVGSASTTGHLTVEKAEELIAPKFRRGLQDQTTKPGAQLTLEIEVDGKPKAVKWYKANNELHADQNIKIEKVDDAIYRLTIPSVRLEDAGDYSVEVTNDQGSATSEGKVAVEALKFPTIVKGLHDVQAEEGAKAVFEVEVSGKPNTVKWYKNGREVISSKVITIDKVDDAHYRLTVESVSPDDEASYRVEAGNEAGTVASEAALTIKQRAAPKEEEPMEVEAEAEATLTVVKGLEDQKVNEGEDITLEVQLSVAPALLKWYKGGKELKADTDKRITIEKVDETLYRLTVSGALVDDTGNYKVVASNAAGTVGSEAKVAVEPVIEKPNIVKGLQDTEAPEGGKVSLEVEVLGKPKQVKWYKNGKELSADEHIKIEKVDDTHYRLTISDVKKDDEASYKVETSNDAGTDSSEAALTVTLVEKKPAKKEPSPVAEATLTIVKGLEDAKSDEGLDVTFEVELSDKATSFKWYKGGAELTSNKRIQIEKVNGKVYRLTVTKVQIDDGGTYKFEASNAAGSVASSAKLSVQPKAEQPKIVKGLKNADVEEGANVTFEVEVTGKPKTIKWFKNGKELAADERIKIDKVDDSHFRLTLPNAGSDDEATYRVELGNDVGTADSDASLTVRKRKPKEEKSPEPAVPMEAEVTLTIVKQLEDQTADDGDNVAFDVELSDKPKTVKWYRNGEVIKPDKQYRLEDLGDNKFRLLITGVSKDEEASYKVEAGNDSGTASSEAKLIVKGVAPKFKKGLEDKSATAGVKIILEVEVEGKPKTVKWYKNGKELKANKRILIEKVDETTHRLTFTAVEKDDAGPYKVEATNDYGTATTEGTLKVEEPPKKAKSPEKPSFSKPLADQDEEEGAKVAFEVEVTGKPKSVKWYKNGREIKPDKRIRIEQLDEKTYRVVIGEATKDDEATYKVEASNDAGTVDCEARLTVHPPKPTKEPEEEGVAAKFVLPLRSETVPEDQSVSLTCRVKGTPFPEVAWLKDNIELEASERVQLLTDDDGKCELVIKEARADDTGTYTCLAQNVHGGDRTKCTLNVEKKAGAEEIEVGEPPEFVKPLRNKTVIEGEDLILEVKIVGKPMPEVCWYKNGDEIIPSDRVTGQIDCISDEVIFRLHIKNARLDDTHTYKCVAHNIHGEASSAGKITVESLKPAEQAPAKFVLPLQETSVVEGKTAIFDVKVRGRPTPELAFYKDRKEISESARVHIEDLGDNRWRLTIENVSSTDAGLYEARCTNSLGSDLCEAHLAVQPSKDRRRVGEDQYPPVFNVPLHDRRVLAGSDMTVECYVDAKPRAQIKWYKGEVALEEDDRVHIESYPDGKCRLRILNFLKEDEGLYKCVATNDQGTASTYANLTVEIIREEERIIKKEYAPFFTRDLTDRKVAEGAPFTLECQVDGAPTPDIRWFKDGVPLVPSARVQIEHLDDGACRLTVDKAIASDMGAYRCVASNKHGASNSVCLVAVEGPKVEKKKEGEAPTFLKGLTDLWIEKGTPFTLRCQVTGTPKPEVKWYKDGTIVRGNDRIDIAYSDDGMATLTIQDSSFADEGFYRCVAENPLGSANSIGTVRVQALREKRQITLEEGEAPKFVVPLEDWSCTEGSTVEFDCKVTGRPAPTLKWYKDGGQLLPDHRVSFEQMGEGRYRLTIQGTKGLDEGTYRCVATNEAGAATSKAQLKLEGPSVLPPGGALNAPSFAVPLRDVRAVEGNPIVLECKLNGEPLPEVKWYKDGELLLPSDRVKIETYPDGTARLYIDKCHPGDEGIYRIVAENPSGTANMKANVSVKKAFVPTEAGVLEEDLAKERAPKVIQPLESEASKEGFSVTLGCRITGIPTPTIHWFKDGEPVYAFGRHQMEHKPDGTIQLRIDQLTVEDAGTYRCVAENDLGTARTTCQLTVEGKVKKTPSTLADELAKGKAPGFLTPLTVKRVPEGNTVVFECLPYGNPFPVIKWLKDGVELNPSDKISIESLNDNTQRLTIHEALVADEGFYRCVASNEYGTSSTKAELIVEADLAKRAEAKRQRYEPVDEGPPQEQKPRFRRGLRNVTVNQGTPAEFEVAIAGHPAPTVKWYKNGEELASGDRVLTWQDEWGFNRLVVLNAQSEDEAEYSVEASNPLGTAKSECSLSVLKDRYAPALAGEEALPSVAGEERRPEAERKMYPPGFMRQIKNKHVFTGFPAIFDCIVIGHPPPDVVWYHNGKPVQPDGRIKIQKCGGGSHALVIFKTTPEDEGEYVCKASNCVGTASSSAVLEVTVPLLDKLQFDGHYDYSQWLGDEFDFRRVPYAGFPSPPDRGPFIAEVTGHYLTLSWIPTRRSPPRYPQISYIVEMRELPDKEWVVVDYNVAQPCCKVRNMELGKSYQFRVRAENIYGISEPSPSSPPSQLMAPPKPVLDKRRRPIPLLDPYAQEALSKAYGDQYACAPWFAPRATDKTACGEREALEVTFFVYGFPDPEVKWYFRGWEVDSKTPGSRFETKCYGGTECVLKIKDFKPEDAGQYQCIARNVHGEAQQHIFVELASLPIFLQPLDNKVLPSDRPVRLDCRVDGSPYPEIKWFKDWHPIVKSSRIKLTHEPPYLHTLLIQDPIIRDTGIYTCTAVNEAGRVSSTATVTIQAEPSGFEHVELPPRQKPVLLKPRKLREFYEVEEEEIQKDPRFTVHRVTEKATGRKFLAKIMPGKARHIAQNEIDLWNRLFYHPNLPYIWDAFDDGKEVAIVYEKPEPAERDIAVMAKASLPAEGTVSGGGLLDRIVADERVPEARIAFFMRQLLQALEHMHSKNIVHMDLKPENIMLSENGSDQIKLTDFGLSRRLRRDKPTYGVLGAPEFVAPEVVAQKPVSLATDMWSVGVLAYLMLSGRSPFLGDSDTETLANVSNARWNFDPKFFELVSPEAKDFISKLLVLDPKKRLDVQDALAHPWVQLADAKGEGELLTTQFLKEFKYRHQWVERRIFVQYGNDDDETARAKLFTDNLEWLEPTYFPLPPSAAAERAQTEATIPLLSARLVQRPPTSVHPGEAQFPDTKPGAKRGPAGDQRRRRGDGGEGLEDIPDFSVYAVRGERRPIEDELASRILSDISEEGSMMSEEVASSRPYSVEDGSLVEDRLGESADVNEYERTTPTQDDYPATTVIKMAPGNAAQMTVEVDEAPDEKPALKSPVRLSPTKEEVMECIVASKKPESPKPPPAINTGVEPKALLPLQRSAKLADHEFEQLMANAERVKAGLREQLRDGKPPQGPPREVNGYGRQRGPARPLTDFDVPYPAYELDDHDWDTQYQMGPETFLLQLRDAGMATRVRDYRRYLYGDSASYVVNGWLGDVNTDITLRERRRYTDLVKSNKDLQEAARDADRSTEAARLGAIKRSRGIQSTLAPAPMISSADGTHSPIFQTRLKDTVFAEDGQATFQCTVLANPPAEIVWFHNDAAIMLEAGVTRHTMTYENSKAVLVIKPALAMDAGTYKCLAKNPLGESFSEAKLRLGDAPDRTSRPDVELASDTEVFITWEAPTPRSGSDIIGYKLEFRRAEEWTGPWFVVSDNLDEEAVVVRKLEPLGIYQFKVTPRNTYGWGEPSLASRIIQTHSRGAPKLNIELLKRDYHLNMINLPQGGTLGEIPEEGGSLEGSPSPSERREQAIKTSLELNTKDDPKARFQLESEIFRGRFCLVRYAVDKQSENAAHCVAKVLMANAEMRKRAMNEYETLREIQHEHVVSLLSAYLREDFLILFLEKLSDNLIERFTYQDYYTEEQVARVMSQLLSALQWIHFKKICHLDLQPDNIMFPNKRSWNVKLLDTGTAVRLDVEKGESRVDRLGAPEYSAPEVLHTGCVTPAADIWGIGLLSYLLLSGMHPFMVDDVRSQEEVVRNIVLEKLDLNFVYTNTSQEALRFVTWALKKQPGNRMNTEEGLQHRWLSFHETMIRRRENIKFSANRLRTFARSYYHMRRVAATNNNQLLTVYGSGDTGVKRSSSFTHTPTKSSYVL